MSLVSFIGPRPNLLDLEGTSRAQAPRSAPADPHQRGPREDPLHRRHRRQPFHTKTLDITYPAEQGAAGMDGALDAPLRPRRGAPCTTATTSSSCPTGWSAPTASPIPALLATAAVHNHLIRKGLRTSVGLVVETGEAREVHHFCVPRRLRRRGDQPLSRLRDAARHARRGELPGRGRRRRGRLALHQVDRQGHAQGDVQDGHLDLPVLLRRADLRRRRPVLDVRRPLLLRHRDHASRAPASPRSPRRRCAATATPSATTPVLRDALDVGGEYAFRLRGEDHVWTPDTVARPPARRARQRRRDQYRAIRGAAERAGCSATSPSAACSASRTRRGGRPRRRCRSRRSSRRPRSCKRFSTGAMSLRLDLARGAHDARHRHEPDRRQVEHRRGRRGGGPLPAAAERRFDALGDQAGGLGPLRRHDGVPRQLRHDADQDGAGRQARRGRPAARPQGRRGDRQGAPLDAGRRPDLAAAAPRHLFDRGSGAADLRPEERQPGRPTSR